MGARGRRHLTYHRGLCFTFGVVVLGLYSLSLDESFLLNLYESPVALYTAGSDRGFSHDCCLTNHLLRTIGRIELGCKLARKGDFVVLPEDLDEGGAFRTHFPVLPGRTVEVLGTAMEEKLGCQLVGRSALPPGIRWVSYDYGRKFGSHPVLQEWLAMSISLPSNLISAVESCGGAGSEGSLIPTVAVHMRLVFSESVLIPSNVKSPLPIATLFLTPSQYILPFRLAPLFAELRRIGMELTTHLTEGHHTVL